MKIVATIEVKIPDIDEESKGQWDALNALKNNPEEMMNRIWDALDGDGEDFGIHSPHIEEGDI
jgi:hypothetical protein